MLSWSQTPTKKTCTGSKPFKLIQLKYNKGILYVATKDHLDNNLR